MYESHNSNRKRLSEHLPAPDLSWKEACELLHAELDRLSVEPVPQSNAADAPTPRPT
jgi:hypothetical protein